MKTNFKKQTGLILDISRHFYPIEALKSIVDLIKSLGGNYLQLHMSDDTNYAIESKLLRQTTADANQDESGRFVNPVTGKAFLSAAQIADLAAHAKTVGIELIPELGSPGHMGALFGLYHNKYGNDDIKNAYGELRYTTPSAIEFVQQIYAEVIGMFGQVKHFHIGGDEHGATYNDTYNQEFVDYANKQAAYLKTLGVTTRMWNDGVMKSTMSNLDKSIEITYWSWDGGKSAERDRLIAIRAGMNDIIKAGFTVYNCNSYYTYSVPRGQDKINGDAVYATVDSYHNWTLDKWDDNHAIPDDRAVNVDDVAGSAMSIWGERLQPDQTWQDIIEALKPHIRSIFDVTNFAQLSEQDMARVITKRDKPQPRDIVPGALYAIGSPEGVEYFVGSKDGSTLIPQKSAGLTEAQTIALNRLQAGAGATIKLANLTDVATTTIDADVATLEVASYSSDSGKGGGTFKRVSGKPALSDGMIVKSKDGSIWQRVTDDGYMYPEYLGWVSSTNDDKAFLSKLFTAAGVLGLNVAFSPENTFSIIGITNIDRRVKKIDARWAKFIFGTDGKVRNGGFTYTNTSGGYFTRFDISYTDALRDLNVSGSKGECCGFWFEAVNGVTITKNKIKATNAHGILVRMKGKATADCVGNTITDNVIDIHRLGANDAKQGILFDVEDSTTTAMDAYWQANKTVYESSAARHRNHVISGNIITGSRYGVCLYYAEDCVVEHNKVTDCVRGYVQQNKCRRNKFRFNEVYEFTSAAFLMNYNTCYSIIENNYGRSTVVNGQAPLHISVQGEGNICRFNTFDIDSADGAAWWMYCGVACKDNMFYKNVYRGKVKRAAVMVESAWTNNDDATGSYGSQKSGNNYLITPDWGVGHTSGTVVQDNEFHFANTTPSVPLAVIHAGTDNNGDHNLLNTEFTGNKLIASVKPTVLFKLVEAGNSKVQGTIYGQNKWVGGATSSQLIMGDATAYADNRPDINLVAV